MIISRGSRGINSSAIVVAALCAMLVNADAAARTFVIVRTLDGEVFNTTGTGPISIADVASDAGWAASATALANHGTSRAIANTLSDGSAAAPFAEATAGWEDVFTINGGTSGTLDTVRFGITVTGLLTGTHSDPSTVPRASVLYTLDRGTNGTTVAGYSTAIFEGSEPVANTFFADVEFIYGNPFLLRGFLELATSVSSAASNPAFGTAGADFLSTALVSQVILPPGATLISRSGANYPVPLPAALPLMLTALAGLPLGARARSRAT